MNIALVAPFEETVPPRKYGGTELVVAILAEELQKMGHTVTLIASGDSTANVPIIPGVRRAIRVLPESRDVRTREAYGYRGIARAVHAIQQGAFDIVHNHIGWQFLAFRHLIKSPILTTLHGTLADEHENRMYRLYKNLPFVSISDSQRAPLPELRYEGTVHHGLQIEKFTFQPKSDDYLLFLGRFSPEKGPHVAIELAKRTGQKLIMAAKIDPTDEAFFNRRVKPHIDGKQIVNIGEVGHAAKVKLLGKARALISAIQWDEPFGLVNIEALACGTPVIALSRGALSEIITHGHVGFLCHNKKEMAAFIPKIASINRQDCRAYAEQRFCARRMALEYLGLYSKLAAKGV